MAHLQAAIADGLRDAPIEAAKCRAPRADHDLRLAGLATTAIARPFAMALRSCSKMLRSGMASGVPVRLSEALTVRARAAAEVLDRSLTEQVEHWARLGQVVEGAISARTVQRLKARSYDADLAHRLTVAATAEGRARAARLIRERNPVRHGVDEAGAIVRIGRRRKRSSRPRPR